MMVTDKPMELIRLEKSARFHQQVSHMFNSEWKHPNTRAELVSICVIKNTKDPKLELRFHGTQRACSIGSSSLEPCDNDECYLCSILENGFSLEYAKPTSMFGSGIYSTVVSSKANIYAKNHGVNSKKHVLILCGIDPGKVKTTKGAGDPGLCDSVEGLTRADGGRLVYQESVMYDEARIKPIGLVVYTREA
ncbi:uncharacterized protein N7484_011775 [Penicillium longicatenatum]|uniref:uncharacterized protein n=1 Tax=Penicillium longicatenatum TaxID=1561947 RepID=UPI0025479809|nr:uncharacterized protein N7484_011775 [Penicillium longicatenatum]KAJ5631675.1 hypothetical protein N7484_011775 [Penicillium longicatenatum]